MYLHDWYGNMGYQVALTPQHVQGIMMEIDHDFKGHFDRQELHNYLRKVWNQPQQMVPNYQQQQPMQMPQQRPQVIVIKGKNVNW